MACLYYIAMIIEDDYDGLFYYGANLPPSLKSMDIHDNVIYLASLWQVLYSLTTLCFSVLPLSLVEVIRRAKQSTVSLIDSSQQLAITELLNGGYLQKHVRKFEQLFATRRQTMLFELKFAFGPRIHLPSKSCGLTVMAQFHSYTDEVLSRGSRRAGLPMVSTESLYCDIKNRSPGEWSICFPALDERRPERAFRCSSRVCPDLLQMSHFSLRHRAIRLALILTAVKK